MPFTAIAAATVSIAASAAAARAQQNHCPTTQQDRRGLNACQANTSYSGLNAAETYPGGLNSTADLFQHKPTAKVMEDLRADAWSEQNTTYVAKCVTALLFVVAVWIGVVLWSSSKSPEPVPSTQLERSN